MQRRYVVTSVIAVGLLAASAVPLLATSEDSPPSDPGEPPEFIDGGVTAQATVGEPASEEQLAAASITTGSTTYDPTTLTKFVPGTSLIVESQDSSDIASVLSGCVSPTAGSGGIFTEGVVPVELPDGALLTGVTFHGRDSDPEPGDDITFRVWETTTEFPPSPIFGGGDPSLTSSQLASANSSTWDAGDAASSVFADVDPDVTTGSSGFTFLGTTHRFYYLEVEMLNDSLGSHRFCGAEVFYRVPSTGDNQTFTPLEPCIVFDSRPPQGGTGKFSGEETRTVTITGDTSGQGGAGDCGISTSATSVQLNMIVLAPNGVGTLKVWAAGASEPNGLVAYTGGVDRWNGSSVVPISTSDQISIKTQNNGANVALVATGYYSPMANMGN